MTLAKITLPPGVFAQYTPALAGAHWNASQLIRFHDGLPQKLGGWQQLTATALVGLGRGMHAWADLAGNPYLAVGTEQRLQLFASGIIYDITPIRATTNPTPNFSTVINTAAVKIVDTANGAAVGDWIYLNVPVSVGGLVLQGFYQVATVVDGNTYTVTASAKATATVNAGGAVPLFTTVNTSPNVSVTLNNHGLTSGALFAVQVSTTVATIAMAGTYPVTSVTNSNVFVITPGGTANASTTGSENGGDAQIWYLIPTGLVSAVAETGYGIGPYGGGQYGLANQAGPTLAALRQWFLDNWGQDLVGNYYGSPLYVWTPPVATGNVAIQINTSNFPGASNPPQVVNTSFVAMPEQILMCFGVDPIGGGGAVDPNLVRWCDVADFTDWTATAVNQAGSFRIPTGSQIEGAIQGPQYGYLWTNVDFWSIQYIQPPLVFGFNKIASGCELIAARAAGLYEGLVLWVSNSNFFLYDGNSVQVLACTVWDFFVDNLDRSQSDKMFCAVNSHFSEVGWFFPSKAGDGEVDSYVKYNVALNVWDYGALARTCWIDGNVYGPPIATDLGSTGDNSLLQQHDIADVYDANGQPMMTSVTTGFFDLQDGTLYSFVERVIPDFILDGGSPSRVYISFLANNYPSEPVTTYGPYPVVAGLTKYIIPRIRARQVAIQISSNDLGVFWRLGAIRYSAQPAGSR